jgi:O-antigen/teichoic acid export membrane protein
VVLVNKIHALMKLDLVKRLMRGVGANGYSQLVTLFIQLAAVPVLITYWGVEQYGIWIALSALPSYLASSNLGVANAAASEMTVLTANKLRNKENRILKVYHTACALTLIMFFIVLIVSAVALYYFPGSSFIFNDVMDVTVLKTTLMLLVLYTLITLFGGLWDAVFRSTGRYAQGTVLLHTIRLVEQVALLLSVVLFSTDMIITALVLVCVRALGTLITSVFLYKKIPSIPFGIKEANLETFRYLLPASLGFMAMPIGYALFMQGMILVAASFSGVFVVVFSTTRTLTSLGRQIVSMITHATWPELSRAFGEGDSTLAKKIFITGSVISLCLLFIYFVMLAILGDSIFRVWTGGEVMFNYALFYILAFSAVFGALWNQAFTLLASINKHMMFSFIFVLAGLILVVACYLMQQGNSYSELDIMLLLPVAELLLVIIAYYLVYKLMGSKGVSYE